MPKFNVHLYREMKLWFPGIEADTTEAAAAIAREKPTADADDIEDCNGEDLAALIDVAGDEDYSQSVTIDFEAERQRKAAAKLLDALRWIIRCPKIRGPVGTTAYIVSDERMTQAGTAVAEASAAGIAPAQAGDPPAGKPFSVLLLYPDYASDQYGTETYYAFVEAASAIDAVAVAQRQAAAAQGLDIDDPADFAPLLVTEGHHASEPLSNR